MNKRERLQATIAGAEVDRAPVALWRHQPVDDQSGERLAAATLAFQAQFDFDFVKVTPASSYCVRDWGATDTWNGHPHGTRDYGRPVINAPSDWEKLSLLDPRAGQMGEVLVGLQLIGNELSARAPFIQTIFSPLTQAGNLAGSQNLLVHLREHPAQLLQGLDTITQQTMRFVAAARDAGVDGIFYAVQWASSEHLSLAEYREFGRPFDLQILEAVADLWLNVLHLHGSNIMFDEFMDYPAAILNWHDRETWPALREGLERWPHAVCGGIRQEATLMAADAAAIRAESVEALQATGGRRFVLGTGCVAPIVTPYGNLMAARRVVEE